MAPYTQICVRLESPKVGNGEGRNEEWSGDEVGEEVGAAASPGFSSFSGSGVGVASGETGDAVPEGIKIEAGMD